MASVKKIKTRGTVLRVTITTDWGILERIKNFKDFRGSILHKIGRSARKALQKGWLSSKSSISSLEFKGFKKDKAGNYKVINRIGERGIIFTAPPLNAFEFGRKYVDKPRQPSRKILTVRFRNYLHAKVQTFAERAIRQTIVEMS